MESLMDDLTLHMLAAGGSTLVLIGVFIWHAATS